jgi:hypothetical protein
MNKLTVFFAVSTIAFAYLWYRGIETNNQLRQIRNGEIEKYIGEQKSLVKANDTLTKELKKYTAYPGSIDTEKDPVSEFIFVKSDTNEVKGIYIPSKYYASITDYKNGQNVIMLYPKPVATNLLEHTDKSVFANKEEFDKFVKDNALSAFNPKDWPGLDMFVSKSQKSLTISIPHQLKAEFIEKYGKDIIVITERPNNGFEIIVTDDK